MQTWKKKQFFVNTGIFGMHIWRKKCINYNKFKIATNCINQILNLNAFFFFLFTGATWYYNTICLAITYFASFTDYEDDIFEVISNRHVQGSKFGGKIYNFGRKSFLKSWTPRSSWSLFVPGLPVCRMFDLFSISSGSQCWGKLGLSLFLVEGWHSDWQADSTRSVKLALVWQSQRLLCILSILHI